MTEKKQLPIYQVTDVGDADRDPCRGCRLDSFKSNCKYQPLRVYSAMGEQVATQEVDLLVVADVPSFQDNKASNFFGDQSGKSLLRRVKSLGYHTFAVIPSVRCYPGGDIDHYVLTKKYKNNRYKMRETPLQIASQAVEHCKHYVERAIIELNPKVTLAMGPIATKALGIAGNIPNLRSLPLRPKKGIRGTRPTEGTVVTYDRFASATNDWVFRDLNRDITKVENIKKFGFANPRGDDATIKLNILDTVKKVKAFVDQALSKKSEAHEILCFDFETEGLDLSTETNKILNVGFSWLSDEDTGYVIPLAHPETPFDTDELAEVFSHLKRLFASKGATFYAWAAHAAQFEISIVKLFFDVWLGEAGDIRTLDTMVLAYELDEERSAKGIDKPYRLETLAREFLDFRWYAKSAMKSKRDRLSSEPIDEVNTYVGMDAVVTVRLLAEILERMQEEGSDRDLLRLATKLYGPAQHYTVDLRLTGQEIDVSLLRKLRAKDSAIIHRIKEIEDAFAAAPEVAEALSVLSAQAHGGAGMKTLFKSKSSSTFSLNSQEHRRALFWDVLELEGADESVDKKFQEKHKAQPLVALFAEYQSFAKLESTYLAPIAKWLQSPNSVDGRLRPSFNLINTKTGRLSASDPNTQNQPRGDSVAKKQIKAMFKAPKKKVLVQLDFSQAEVRWLGILSGDEALAEKYRKADEIDTALLSDPNNEELKRAKKIDGDLHMSTAIMMYKLDPDIVFKDEKQAKLFRQRAKSVCFGLIYGKSAKSLAKDLGISEEEADEAVELWLSQFPKAAAWLTQMEDFCVEHGYVKSPFGRWRRLPEVQASDISVVNRAKRQSRNTPIQSAASDCCIYAAVKLRDALRTSDNPKLREARLINTVHDSLVAELPADEDTIREYCKLAKAIFTDRNMLKKDFGIDIIVPLAVDFDIGVNWGNLVDYDFTDKSLRRALHDAEVLRNQPPGTLFSDLKGKGLLFDEIKKKEAA